MDHAVHALDMPQTVRRVGASMLQDMRSWIFMPREVEVEISTHSEGGLTAADFELAGKIDALG